MSAQPATIHLAGLSAVHHPPLPHLESTHAAPAQPDDGHHRLADRRGHRRRAHHRGRRRQRVVRCGRVGDPGVDGVGSGGVGGEGESRAV